MPIGREKVIQCRRGDAAKYMYLSLCVLRIDMRNIRVWKPEADGDVRGD